jgi:osmotically-inducible protein OsmY
VTAALIGITAKADVVTSTKCAETFAQKQAAEIAALRMKGVKAVAEEIQIELPFERTRGYNDIVMTAVDRLPWDTSVPPDAISVKAEQGWVTLADQEYRITRSKPLA